MIEHIAKMAAANFFLYYDLLHVFKDDYLIYGPGACNIDPVFELQESYIIGCNDVKDDEVSLAVLHAIDGANLDVNHPKFLQNNGLYCLLV